MRLLRWFLRHFETPRARRAVILIAIVLALPALLSSLFIDEYMQAERWKEGLIPFLNRCFVFADGSLTDVQRELHGKIGAWWAAPDFKVAFWRPLSAATLALDHLLWPRSSLLMHVHSLLWFVALLFVLRTLYERFLTPRVAVLALALFAWDDARGMVLSWVAKRNVLVAGVFAVCALIAHDKWRRDGWRAGAWLAPILLAASLLSSEAALATVGFLLAYAWLLDKGSLAQRLGRLAPHVLVVGAWQAAYLAGGFGANAPGFHYVHPLRQPLAYLLQLAEAAPLLILGQLTPVPSDIGGGFPVAVKVVVCVLAVALPVVLVGLGRKRLAGQPLAAFWVIGSALALFPVCAAAPTDSNLLFVSLGAAPALSMLFSDFVEQPAVSRWPRLLIASLAVFNLAIAPLLLPLKCLYTRGTELVGAKADHTIPADSGVKDKTMIVVSVMFDGHLAYVMARRGFEGVPQPRGSRLLAVTSAEVTVTRPDEVTLRVRPARGYFETAMERMYNDPARPFRQGDVVELADLKATVAELTDDGRPWTVEYRFSEPLESPRWLWLRGEGFGFVGWTPPRIGEAVTVAGASN